MNARARRPSYCKCREGARSPCAETREAESARQRSGAPYCLRRTSCFWLLGAVAIKLHRPALLLPALCIDSTSERSLRGIFLPTPPHPFARRSSSQVIQKSSQRENCRGGGQPPRYDSRVDRIGSDGTLDRSSPFNLGQLHSKTGTARHI